MARSTEQTRDNLADDETDELISSEKVEGTAVYDRKTLTWGHEFQGPAIIDQYDTTVFIPEGFSARVDRLGNIIGELK